MMRQVLILDDEEAVLGALYRALRRAFGADTVEIERFCDPEAALLRAGEKDFDVVIADYRMPGLNGADVFSLLKRIQPAAVRILLSASTKHAEIMDAVERGDVFRYLAKPWDYGELIEVVDAAFDRHRLPESGLALSRQQLETLRLEREEPGITWVNRDEHGNILL
ncbi:MAG: response regulator [Telluria sp.]